MFSKKDTRLQVNLHEELLDALLYGLDDTPQFAAFVGGHAGSHHGATDAARPSQRDLAGDEDVGDVLVFAQQRQVQDNLNGLRIRRHDDELRDSSVERLCSFVCALLQLAVM